MIQEQDQNHGQEMRLEPGVWQGAYMDAKGYRANVRLDLKCIDDRIEGKYELEIATEDEPQCIRGQVEGNQGKNDVELRLAPEQSKDVSLRYQAVLKPAGSHAKQCLMGVVTAPEKGQFGGGVWIAWRYATAGQHS